MAATNDMLSIKSLKPDYVCIVPEKRQELTTEGGLDLNKNFNKLENMIRELKVALGQFPFSLNLVMM